MLARDVLNEMRERSFNILEQIAVSGEMVENPTLEQQLARDVSHLLAEMERIRKLHTKEQGLAADRLREVLEK